MALADDYPALDSLLTELFEAAGDLKLALKDGHITADEIVAAIPDDAVSQYVGTLVKDLQQLPAEIARVVDSGPWGMMSVFQALASKVMSVLK
jgi:hypothetical protein